MTLKQANKAGNILAITIGIVLILVGLVKEVAPIFTGNYPSSIERYGDYGLIGIGLALVFTKDYLIRFVIKYLEKKHQIDIDKDGKI